MAYATTTELATYLSIDEADLPADAARLLDRASELIDDTVVVAYDGTDTDVLAALRDATSAQVEFWIEVGEEHDVTGQRGEIRIDTLHIMSLPGTLAPRAKRFLFTQNLLSRRVTAL